MVEKLRKFDDISDDLAEIYFELEEEYNNGKKIFSTGFEDLDCFIGGVQKGNLIVIGSRPAMGKTTLCCSLINNLLEQKKKIAVFTLELTKENFIKRLLSEKTKIPIGIKMYNRKMNIKDWQQLAIAIDYYKDKKLAISDKSNLTVEEFEEKIKETKPEIVFLDYIQLLKMPKAPNLTDATNLAIQEIKRIALENNIIVFMTSQLSRSVEYRDSKIPKLSDLRNGNLLEELSDMVLMLHREEYYNPDNENEKNIANIIVLKNKFGPTGESSLYFKYPAFVTRRNNIIDF